MRRLLSAIALIIVALMVDVSTAAAQQPGRVYKIGWLWIGRPDHAQEPMEKWRGDSAVVRDGLRDSGYVLGKNLIVHARHAQGDVSRLAAEAEALVGSNVDAIITVGTQPTLAAMQATKSIPIIFNGVGDPEWKGMVANLARPGGNVTGMAVQIAEPKLWQLLRDVSPNTRRAGAVVYAPNAPTEKQVEAYSTKVRERRMAAAAAVGIESIRMSVNTLGEIESQFGELASSNRHAGIIVYSDLTMVQWRTSVMELAIRNRLATSCPQLRLWAEAGCLVTYAEDSQATNRRVAEQVAKVLKGAKPADIPVEQPSSFKLIINLKTAKALGLTVPTSLLVVADEIIE